MGAWSITQNQVVLINQLGLVLLEGDDYEKILQVKRLQFEKNLPKIL